MTPSERYLEVPPWEAFIMMVNDQYHFDLNPETTILVEIETLTDKRVEVTIAAKRSQSLRNLLPTIDQFTFVLTRMDIGEYFGGTVTIPSGELHTLTTVDIVGWLCENIDEVVFDKDDIIHELFTSSSPVVYQLRAHPRSLRWVGELTININ